MWMDQMICVVVISAIITERSIRISFDTSFWKVENGGQGGRVGRGRRKMEIRVNTGPSSPRENKSSVIWEFSSGASIDNNLAQPYIQQKYNVKLSFAREYLSERGHFSNRISIP